MSTYFIICYRSCSIIATIIIIISNYDGEDLCLNDRDDDGTSVQLPSYDDYSGSPTGSPS